MKASSPMSYGVSCVTMAVFGAYETPSVVHHRLMMLVDTRMHVWHLVVLVLIADVRDGVFEGDESRHQID